MKNHDCMPRKVVFGVESSPAGAVPVLDKI